MLYNYILLVIHFIANIALFNRIEKCNIHNIQKSEVCHSEEHYCKYISNSLPQKEAFVPVPCKKSY